MIIKTYLPPKNYKLKAGDVFEQSHYKCLNKITTYFYFKSYTPERNKRHESETGVFRIKSVKY